MVANPDRTIKLFTNSEEQALSEKNALDELDRRILALILIHPKWSNTDIGEEVGLNRIQVWRRRTKGPLGVLLLEFQREALTAASDLVILEARGAVEQLGKLCRGDCDCPPFMKKEVENHAQLCLTPVPYAVRRAAAKDLVEILQSRPKEDGSEEEEVWESFVSDVGGVQTRLIVGTKNALNGESE